MEKATKLIVYESMCRGCGSCQLACSFVKAQVFNPIKSAIRLDYDIVTGNTAPAILPLSCNLCGGFPTCVNVCPYDALSTKEKPGLNYKILVAV
ncbi:MAG: 4Fe-4S dicluster domain-containing protein [Candidatus Methanomethyliaceae archaeon]